MKLLIKNGKNMQFIDLKTQNSRIKEKVDASILNVLDHGRYVFGQEIIDLEENL
jgi:UDP-2-acetamido-2-deoxy-ribo-hexuluronate aminotransferase